MQCSDKRLRLGIAWREPCCAARMGRPHEKFGHTNEQKSPQEFGKLLLIPDGLDVRSIPSCFHPWLDGECQKTINPKISTGCIWDVDLKEEDGKIIMDVGWSDFVNAHVLMIGYFLVFKKLDTRSLKVTVFDHSGCEKVIRCAGYHPSPQGP